MPRLAFNYVSNSNHSLLHKPPLYPCIQQTLLFHSFFVINILSQKNWKKKRELSGPLPGERWSDSFASLNTQLPLFTNFSFKLSPPEKLTYFTFCFHNLIIWLVVFLCNSFTPSPFPLIFLSTLGLGSLLKAFLFTHLQHITNHKALMI